VMVSAEKRASAPFSIPTKRDNILALPDRREVRHCGILDAMVVLVFAQRFPPEPWAPFDSRKDS
jgi:hypothetical protein